MGSSLLRIEELKTWFFTSLGIVKAVDGVSFDIEKGESVGLVGESGSGKSVTAHSIMRLVPDPPGRIVSGNIVLEDLNLVTLDKKEMQSIRGARIAMSFQDPMTYLNPAFRVGEQIAEAITIHQGLDRNKAHEEAVRVMKTVRIPDSSERAMDFPHQLSGGMRQRILLAMAISCKPQLLIADEPTTALDVIVQSEILELLVDLKRELSLSLLLISHDLGVVAHVATRVAIMYAGNIVEFASTESLYKKPIHPYSRGLLSSIPTLEESPERLHSIAGDVPDLINPPSGCKFHPRCQYARDVCKRKTPVLKSVQKGHYVSCLRVGEI
mgnify:FL=1